MRRVASLGLLLAGVVAGVASNAFAQGKKACELVTRAEVGSILGVTLKAGR